MRDQVLKSCAFHVLGCKVNQNEIEAFKNIFREKGYKIVPFNEKADIYVIHTCTVTNISDKKSRQYIRKAINNNPQAIIAVTGCYSQVAPEEIEKIPGVDIIVGTKERGSLVQLVEEFERSKEVITKVDKIAKHEEFESLPLAEVDRARAFLKIQEGCDSFCTYCIVPFARGPVRSMPMGYVIDEVNKLVDKGYLEIVLTGIHTGYYGKDFSDPKINLSALIERLVEVPGLKRLRVSSLNPEDFTDDLMRILTNSSIVCPHFHISLQSGDDYILKRMGRRYTTGDYANLVKDIRMRIPETALTTAVIVGFPGEDYEHFENTYEFVKKMEFSDVHVFQYSPRKGTQAYEMENHIMPAEKKKRSESLVGLADKLFDNYAAKFLGRNKEVLVEQYCKDNLWEGHTDNYLPVVFQSSNKNDLHGSMIKVQLNSVSDKKIMGTLINNGR